MREIPAYLFLGFLEAGKTRFIQETLCDENFNDGEPCLILQCEEGEESLDPSQFAGKNVFFASFDAQEDFTREALEALEKRFYVDKIVIEYNGMWPLSALQQALPDHWVVYQAFMFADAGSILHYNANMRALCVDKLQSADLVVFNRFSVDMDKMPYHKLVRGLNRAAIIAYEYADGTAEYDDIKDPLPYDLSAPIVEIADEDYAIFYRDIMEETEKYDGKTVRFKGQVGINSQGLQWRKDVFRIARQVMTCCVEDIQYMPLTCLQGSIKSLHKHDWLLFTGQVGLAHSRSGEVMPLLTGISAIPCKPPENPVATFY